MKQVFINKGKVRISEVPIPATSENSILIKVVNSCISTGSELAEAAQTRKSLAKQVLENPKNVRKAVNILRTESFNKIKARIKNFSHRTTAIGYSASGIVVETGERVTSIQEGDFVAASGFGYASHSEFICVPENLTLKIPPGLSFKNASTVALGGIALHGVRRSNLKIGEFCVVFGTGIIGLLIIQILKNAGVRIAAIDKDQRRLDIANELGAEIVLNSNDVNIFEEVERWSNGYGADAVIFSASTTSSEPISKCFQICRKKGKVILVGVSGLELNREDMYSKELDFIISTSYGPGRYDTNYENKGLDYPYAYIRWTEKRNMAEYLRLLNNKSIQLDKLIEGIYPIDNVKEAFKELMMPEKKPILILIEYDSDQQRKSDQISVYKAKQLVTKTKDNQKQCLNVVIVGMGNFASNVHIPNLLKLKNKFHLYGIVDRKGHVAESIARSNNINYASTHLENFLDDENVDVILICTRHDSHARLVLESLESGKNVFVEKPLATNINELNSIEEFFKHDLPDKPLLQVGYNRRFSKYAQEIKKYIKFRIQPLIIHYRVNAGYIPYNNWVHEDGGRIVGEACHIFDLMTFFTESEIVGFDASSVSFDARPEISKDNKNITIKFADGSLATIQYISIASQKLPKEYMEIHFDGKSIILNDYKMLTGYGLHINRIHSKSSEKGHLQQLMALHSSIVSDETQWPIELWDLVQTSKISIQASK